MDRLRSMQTFVRVAELGSFSRAADAMEVNKATVTTHIAQLEAHLGARLLERTTRRLSLTQDGAAYLEHAQRFLSELEEVEADLSRNRTVARGTLRVDMTVATGRILVLPRLPQFLAKHPELTVVVSMNDHRVDLVEQGIDVAIRIGPLPDSSLVARKVHDLAWVTCASPDYLARRGTPLTPGDLRGHDCLGLYDLFDHRVFKWVFDEAGAPTRFTPAGRLMASNPESLVDAAVAGLGLVQTADALVARDIAAGRLIPVLDGFVRPDAPPVSVVYPQRRLVSAKVRAFADFVAQVFAELKSLPPPPPPGRAVASRTSNRKSASR